MTEKQAQENYVAYLAGGLFTQYDLAANVRLKAAVWRLSNGRFGLDFGFFLNRNIGTILLKQ